MNTVLSRANSLFAFSLSVMAALTFGCFITTAFKDRSVPADIRVSRVMLKNVDDFTGPRERSDLGFITFDLTADILFLLLIKNEKNRLGNLTLANCFMCSHNINGVAVIDVCLPEPLCVHLKPIFDWNVKQLFLYMSAEYATKSNALNQVVLWDKIVLRGENTKLNLRDTKSKYFFFDDGNGLR
ncbi:signal peptidase complex subunit 3 [Aplochiton taeniatus]